MRPREILALVLSPLASGVLQGLLMGNGGAFFFGVTFAYVFAALVGIPTLVVLRRYGWFTLPKYLLAGFVAGAGSGLLLGIFWGYADYSVGSVLGGMLLFSTHGFVVSLAYWMLAYWLTNECFGLPKLPGQAND